MHSNVRTQRALAVGVCQLSGNCGCNGRAVERFIMKPEWAAEGAAEVVVDKSGLLVEFSKRGLMK